MEVSCFLRFAATEVRAHAQIDTSKAFELTLKPESLRKSSEQFMES